MARRTSRTSRVSSTGDSELLLELLKEKYGKQTQPKASALQRIFAPLTAVSSVPDAIYDAIYEKGSIAHAPVEYGKNLLQGLGTTFLGKEPEEMQKVSDILNKQGYLTGQDKASKVVRSGINFAGDVALNPLTYIGFGPMKLAGDVARKSLTSTVGTHLGRSGKELVSTVDKLEPLITGKTVNEAIPIVENALGPGSGELFYNSLTAAGAKMSQAGSLKFLGQTVSSSPKVAEAVKMGINPLYAVTKGGGALAEKIAPDATKAVKASFYDIFDPLKAAGMSGKEPVALEAIKRMRKEGAVGHRANVLTAELRNLTKDFSEEGYAKTPYLLEELDKVGLTDQAGKTLQESEVLKRLGVGSLNKAEKTFITKYRNLQDLIAKNLRDAGGLEKKIAGTYIMHDVKGLNPSAVGGNIQKDALQELSEQMTPERFDILMKDKNVLKDLEKFGYIKSDTIQKHLKGLDVLAGGEKGLMGFSTEPNAQRKFKSLLEGEAGGVVYETDINNILRKQTEGQLRELNDLEFSKVLENLTDPSGNKFFVDKAGAQYKESVKLPGTAKHVYTDSQTKRVLENYFGTFGSKSGLDKALSGFDKVMGFWKGLVTGRGPGLIRYHTRNHIDDNIRMILDGADMVKLPEDYGYAQEVLSLNKDAANIGLDKAMEKYAGGKTDEYLKEIGYKGGIKQFWNEILDNGTLGDVGRSAEEAGQKYITTEMGGLDKALTLGGKTPEFEQLRRVAYYINRLRKDSPVEAAEAVRRTLFNYNELTKTEREVFKRVMPFYSFVKNNIEFQLDTMFNQPGRYSKFINLLDSVKNGFIGPDKEEWKTMPDWLRKDRYSMPVGEEDGKLKVLSGLGLSFEELGELDPQGLISKSNPFLKLLLEQATGQSTFMRRPIEELRGGERYETHPLRGLLGYTEQERGGRTQKTVDPQKRYMAENLPFLSSINTLLSQMGRVGGPLVDKDISKGRSLEGAFELASPAKFYEMDVELSKKGREVDDLDELYKLLYRKGISDRFSKYYIPAEIRDRLLKELK